MNTNETKTIVENKPSLVSILRAAWIAKRNEFIKGKRDPKQIYDGPDGYARRERRADSAEERGAA